MTTDALKIAVALAGSRKQLAIKAASAARELDLPIIDLPVTTMHSWFVNSNQVRPKRVPPTDWCIPISMAVDWRVNPTDLRPDAYPKEYCTFPEPESAREQVENEPLAAVSD
jgi:hypothetical protein